MNLNVKSLQTIPLVFLAGLLYFPNQSFAMESFEEYYKKLKNKTFVSCSRVSPRPSHSYRGPYYENTYANEDFWGTLRLEFLNYEGKKSQEFEWDWGVITDDAFAKASASEHSEFLQSKQPKRTELILTKENSEWMTLQTPPDGNGRVDIFQLNKNTGQLFLYVWRPVVSETKPNETFKFKTEVVKKELKLNSTTKFKCS